MIIATIKNIFTRDLNQLKKEINLYENESSLWIIEQNVSNSAGNLTLHLVGNLKTFVGAVLGNSGYIRDRASEFSSKNISKEILLGQIDETIAIVEEVLDSLNPKNLEEEYPITVFESKTTTAYMLFHLTTHLAYHLGQINYHRRLLDN